MITLSDVKAHLKIENDEEDAILSRDILTAYSFAESLTNRIIVKQQITETYDYFQDFITLKKVSAISITFINYSDVSGIAQIFTDFYLDLRNEYATLEPAYGFNWPATDETKENISIIYDAGYNIIPSKIDSAVLLIIGSLYEQRENHIVGVKANSIPMSAESLLNEYRVL